MLHPFTIHGFPDQRTEIINSTRLAEVTGISHHSANRFLHRENYQPKDMYDEAVKTLNPTYYTDISGLHMPVNYRIYDKLEGKTKNDYFREMLIDVN